MDKVCVFCGEPPESKTSEHVIPSWLRELTGNPARGAEFGYGYSQYGGLVRRTFSFQSFKFPACKLCNQHFSTLEANAKAVTQKILSEDSLSELDLTIVLDWLDKIRVGLWLGFRYLDKDPLSIVPHYHIKDRIRQHDRMLTIFKTDGNKHGLNFLGCDTPSFGLTPSCFSMRINNFCLLNMSYPHLLCRRIGFPYPYETFVLEDERLFCRMARGRERIMLPLLKKSFRIKGTELYQPIFVGSTNSSVQKLYDTEYVRDRSLSWEKGEGRIFMGDSSRLNVYPANPSKEWIPLKIYHFEDLMFEMQALTLEWQTYIDSLQPSLKFLSKEKRSVVAQKRSLSRYYNDEIIKIIRANAKNAGMMPLI